MLVFEKINDNNVVVRFDNNIKKLPKKPRKFKDLQKYGNLYKINAKKQDQAF